MDNPPPVRHVQCRTQFYQPFDPNAVNDDAPVPRPPAEDSSVISIRSEVTVVVIDSDDEDVYLDEDDEEQEQLQDRAGSFQTLNDWI